VSEVKEGRKEWWNGREFIRGPGLRGARVAKVNYLR